MLVIIKKILLHLIDDINSGNCNMTEAECQQIIESLKSVTDPYVSKYEACQLLGISRATFDNMVREGIIPRGEKRKGFKELAWKKHDILKHATNHK